VQRLVVLPPSILAPSSLIGVLVEVLVADMVVLAHHGAAQAEK
jgi:hypothetical protein